MRVLALTAALVMISCTPMRYAQTSISQSTQGVVTQSYDWGEVFCGQGTVCAEVEVIRVDMEPRNGGRVEVTLHNRTPESVAVQIGLEILAANGTRLDSTNFQDVGIPPRQEKVWQMPGIYQKGAKVRVILRKL